MNAEEGYCREVVPLFNFNSKFSSFFATFCRQKVAQKPHGDKFLGATLAVGKTDAFALLLCEKLSVF